MDSAQERKFPDYMGCGQNEEIMAQLDTQSGEKVIFSCVVKKLNRWGMRQDRTLLISNQYLYNIKKDDVKRRISIKTIKAVTQSLKKGNLEFIVHVKSEYDYEFESDFRKEIFDAFKYVSWTLNHANLPVYGVPDKLKDYATSKKDISNGVEVNPREEYRMHKEDIYQDKKGSIGSNTTMNSGQSDSSFNEVSQFEDEVKNSVSTRMYTKNTNENEKLVDLKDFKICSVIGRGSFGKVFLV